MFSRSLKFPLTRLVIYVIALSLLMISLVWFQLHVLNEPGVGRVWWFNLVGAALFLAWYSVLVRVLERRQVTELSTRGVIAELGIGIAIEGSLLTSIIAILAVCGAYSVVRIGLPLELMLATTFFIFGAVNEEIGYRAVIFRLLEEWLGSWAALIITAVLFGASHLLNHNASTVGAIGIALSGLLDTGLFMVTRRIWIVVGGHFAWNMAEGPIFGTSVSGLDVESLLTPRIVGPDWLTGGTFGPEASVIAMVLCLLAGALVTTVAYRRNQFVRPRWKRSAGSHFPYLAIDEGR